MSQLLASLVDGAPAVAVPVDDRGLLYGDGLFETLLLFGGRPVWWPAHYQRMKQSAGRLGIVCPEEAVWRRDVDLLFSLADAPNRAVMRLTLTRGSAGRGYAPQADAPSRRIVSLFPLSPTAVSPTRGLRLRRCRLRLAEQPALAGIKHLNRLELILARLEWAELPAAERAEFDEGLLLDRQDQVICSTLGNLLWQDADGWHTPPLRASGIGGICRQQLLDFGWLDKRPLAAADIPAVRSLAVCNSVRGILPVCTLDAVVLPDSEAACRLSDQLIKQEPAFELEQHPAPGG